MEKIISKNLHDKLTKIANDCLFIETLETRNRDHLDFHEVSVWGLLDALNKAYELGKVDARKELNKNENNM
ncbi:MAG: hypothetical protein PHF62_04480 [Acholeplasmataceae bacterium]|nr:hypothetical protein [Acholeplasmataceae bacterium]